MKRQLPGLCEAARESCPVVPDGLYLVRVDTEGHMEAGLVSARFPV